MKKVRLYFDEIPDGFKDTLGQTFEVPDFDKFLEDQKDCLKTPLIRGNSLFYVSGLDAENNAIWRRASITYLDDTKH